MQNCIDIVQVLLNLLLVYHTQLIFFFFFCVQPDKEFLESEGPSRMKRRRTNSKAFGLDIAKYVEAGARDLNEYPGQAFKDSFE